MDWLIKLLEFATVLMVTYKGATAGDNLAATIKENTAVSKELLDELRQKS